MSFRLAPPACSGGPCDTLLVFPNAEQAFFPTVSEITLRDGDTILGSVSGVYAPAFASPASSMGSSAAIVDFAGILDGTIAGSIRFTLAGGWMSWSGSPGLRIVLGRALAPGLVIEGTAAAITGISIDSSSALAPEPLHSNPEPGTLWLAAGGGAMLWLLRSQGAKRRR